MKGIGEVIATGDRVRGEVIDVDERRAQMHVSLKAVRRKSTGEAPTGGG